MLFLFRVSGIPFLVSEKGDIISARPYGGIQGVRWAGRCGERIERRRWRMKRDERVAAVKILSVRRKAARKFWAPQQDHRPLRVHDKRCGVKRNPPVTASPCQPPLGKGAKGTEEADCHSQCAHWLRNDREFYMGCGRAGRRGRRPLRKRNKRLNGRATARVAPTKALHGVRYKIGGRGRTPPLRKVARSACVRGRAAALHQGSFLQRSSVLWTTWATLWPRPG